jgi:hypothetical protein
MTERPLPDRPFAPVSAITAGRADCVGPSSCLSGECPFILPNAHAKDHPAYYRLPVENIQLTQSATV